MNFCERIESTKVKLNDYFGDKRASIQELTRFICKSDSLQSRLEQFDEWRKVNLDTYEDLPFFDTYLPKNYTDFAINKIRHSTALGMNQWKIHKSDDSHFVTVLTKEEEPVDAEE